MTQRCLYFSGSCEIKNVLGKDKYAEFVNEFGGRTIYVARKPAYDMRNQSILARYNELAYASVLSEEAYSLVAQEYDLSPRTIRRIVKKLTNLN